MVQLIVFVMCCLSVILVLYFLDELFFSAAKGLGKMNLAVTFYDENTCLGLNFSKSHFYRVSRCLKIYRSAKS